MPLSRKKRSRVERRLLHIRDAMNDSCASIGDLPRGLPLSRDNEITAIELTIRDVPDTSPGAGDRCPSRAILTSNNPSRLTPFDSEHESMGAAEERRATPLSFRTMWQRARARARGCSARVRCDRSAFSRRRSRQTEEKSSALTRTVPAGESFTFN